MVGTRCAWHTVSLQDMSAISLEVSIQSFFVVGALDPISQMWNPRPREAKAVCPRHTARKRQSWDLN